ncbi:MAG: aldo/keto reductase [Myxococcota bacterium]|nr:aldo/keto reductase [Myxococcota bacterium]
MLTRTLGRTDVRLSEITLGTWGLASGAYGPVDASRYEAVVKEAWEKGVTTFDVAPLWGDGESEWRTTAALGEHAKDAVFISRAGQVKDGAAISGRFDSQALIEAVEASLTRLRRDRIDVLLLHDPPLKVLQSDLFQKGVEHLIASGKIRAWGASVVTTEDAKTAMEKGASALGIAHHLLEPHVLHDLGAGLKQYGCGVIVRSPLCYGLLAGAWSEETEFPETDHRSRRWDRSAFDVRLSQMDDLRFLVHDGVPDLATAALRFALISPFVGTVCVGARTTAQIAHAALASREPPYLPDEDVARVMGKRGASKPG